MTALLLVMIGNLFALAGSFFFSGMETAAYSSSRLRLRYLADKGHPRATLALRLLDNMPLLVTTILVGNNIVNYCGACLLQGFLQARGIENAEFYTTAAITPVYFIMGESLPKICGHVLGENFFLRGAGILAFCRFVFRPVSFALGAVSKGLGFTLGRLGLTATESSPREDVIAHLDLGTRDGLLSPEQLRMARSVMDMERHSIAALIVPNTQAFTLGPAATRGEALTLMREKNLNWVALTDKNRERVTGIVTARSLLMDEGEPQSPAEGVAQTPVFIEVGLSVGKALSRLQAARAKVGVVAEGKRTLGFVRLDALMDEALGRD